MEEDFDPYKKWFGIRPNEQPPNHYRLLGIEAFEEDRDVVSAAAEQRTVFLRNVSVGPRGPIAQRMLNEVAAAKICLLDREKKEPYDASLREQLAAEIAPPIVSGPLPQVVNPAIERINNNPPLVSTKRSERVHKRPPRNSRFVVFGAIVGLVVIGAGASFLLRPPDGDTDVPPHGNGKVGKAVTEVLESVAEPIDLLAKIDPAVDAVHGQWRLADEELVSPYTAGARINIPFDEIPEEYDLDIEVLHVWGYSLSVGLVTGEHRFNVAFDVNKEGVWLSGLTLLDGKLVQDNPQSYREEVFEDGSAAKIQIRVRKTGVQVVADNEEIVDWEGEYSRLTLWEKFREGDHGGFFIVANHAENKIVKFELTPRK
jgi:hypothetical protein